MFLSQNKKMYDPVNTISPDIRSGFPGGLLLEFVNVKSDLGPRL